MVASTQTGWLLLKAAICTTSGEIKLALVGPIFRRKHVLLPRLAQQALHCDQSTRQRTRSRPLIAVFLADPPAVDENCGRPLALERRNDHVAVLAVAHTRTDEHLLIVAEAAGGEHSAVVKVVNGRGVDGWREGERLTDEAVLELGDELRLPAEALDLPCAQNEGCDGDEGCQRPWLAGSSRLGKLAARETNRGG